MYCITYLHNTSSMERRYSINSNKARGFFYLLIYEDIKADLQEYEKRGFDIVIKDNYIKIFYNERRYIAKIILENHKFLWEINYKDQYYKLNAEVDESFKQVLSFIKSHCEN